MSTLFGVNATKRDVDVPSQQIGVGEVAGRFRQAYDEYTGTLTSGDIIKLFKLPKGARVVEVYLANDDLGTTGALTLGWEASADAAEAADADGFLTNVDLATAANVVKMSEEANVPGQFKKFLAEVQVSATLTASTTASGTIRACAFYVLD